MFSPLRLGGATVSASLGTGEEEEIFSLHWWSGPIKLSPQLGDPGGVPGRVPEFDRPVSVTLLEEPEDKSHW